MASYPFLRADEQRKRGGERSGLTAAQGLPERAVAKPNLRDWGVQTASD